MHNITDDRQTTTTTTDGRNT